MKPFALRNQRQRQLAAAPHITRSALTSSSSSAASPSDEDDMTGTEDRSSDRRRFWAWATIPAGADSLGPLWPARSLDASGMPLLRAWAMQWRCCGDGNTLKKRSALATARSSNAPISVRFLHHCYSWPASFIEPSTTLAGGTGAGPEV